jgi:hypothetical protein
MDSNQKSEYVYSTSYSLNNNHDHILYILHRSVETN